MLKKTSALLCLLAFPGRPCAADVFTVTSTAGDASAGSLGAAILAANAAGGANSIVFQSGVSGTITLTSALPVITSNVAIDASGAGAPVAINGQSRYQVFSVSGAGTTAAI